MLIGKVNRNTNDKKKEWKDKIGWRAAIPCGMFEG